MLNLVLPLCLKIGCGNKDDPKLRKNDIQFTLNLLLNMINPGGKSRSINNGITSSSGGSTNVGSSLAMPNTAGSNRLDFGLYNFVRSECIARVHFLYIWLSSIK